VSSGLISIRDDCRLCAGSDLTLVLSLAPTPPANAFVTETDLSREQPVYPLDLYFCESCGHLQLLHVVDPRELFSNYVYVSGTSASFVRHFEEYAGHCAARFGLPAGGLVVDIGSNDGTLLRPFKAKGFKVLGVDPAEKIAAEATAGGIETICDFFTPALAAKVTAEHGPASLVTANNVFAHSDDLIGFTEGAKALLAPDGVFVFEVSYALDVFENTLFDTIYHEHVAYHTVAPLKRHFERHGMTLFAVEHMASHGGSIRCMAGLADGPHAPDGSVAEAVDNERRLALDKSATWIDFAAKITDLGRQLTALLSKIKSEGKTVAGFGAPAKATTLMYQFGIGPEVVDFIVDDSPLKQGLFTPGLHIPVVPSAQIYDKNPDYLIVLAWNFAEPIMETHKQYKAQGGQFIVPLPNLGVY
jgi:SAM-dependent methyltransferase